MTLISRQPFVRVKCDECGHVFEVNVGLKKAYDNFYDLIDQRKHLCAQCDDGTIKE